jgi:hypothetical protein
MKLANKAPGVVFLLLTVVAATWWLTRRVTEKSAPMASDGSAARRAGASENKPQVDARVGIKQPYAHTPFLGLDDPRWAERNRLRQQDPLYQWRTPIEFFGKVVDQDGHPIPAATAKVSWSGTAEKYGGDGVGHRTLTSDSNGLFELTGVQGKGIDVRVSKDGYHVPQTSNMQGFEYAGFWEPTFIEPDKKRPVIFTLVKRLEAEPTYRIGKRLFLKPPALETSLDLLSEAVQTSSPADIKVRFTRPPDANYEKRFDWSVTIEGENGAELAVSTEEFMLRAPADGYVPKIVREYKQAPGNQREDIHFYVRSVSRKLFAAVEFEMAPYRSFDGSEPASIIVSATVNPNNSPNVEYDPEKDIRESKLR